MIRFEQQIDFLKEVDKLKNIIRRNYLCDGNRFENTAEHSWHLALMVMTLAEHANNEIDTLFKTSSYIAKLHVLVGWYHRG